MLALVSIHGFLAFSLHVLPAQVVDAQSPTKAVTAPTERLADGAELAWCDALVAALRTHDIPAFDRLVDVDAILKRATTGVDVSTTLVRGFCDGARVNMENGNGIYADFVDVIDNGGHLDLLRLRERDGARTALFRSVSTDAGMGYTEFRLERDSAGRVRATDVYFAFSGEYLSSSLRRWFIPAMKNLDRGFLGRLFGGEHVLAKHIDDILALRNKAASGELDEFEKIHAALPAELRRDKTIILMRVSVYPDDDPRYVEALDDLRREHPDDICTAIHSIDAFWLRGETAKTVESVESLRKLVGGDPYLDHLIGGFRLATKDYERAAASSRKAIEGGIHWTEVYWNLVAAELELERFDDVLAALKEMDVRLEFAWNDFTTIAAYAGFVKSPQYAQWLEYLASKRSKDE